MRIGAPDNMLVPTRKRAAPLLAAQRGRYAPNSAFVLFAVPVVMACANVTAAESYDLPPCAKDIRIMHFGQAPLEIHHPPAGRVDLEFTIDALGYVSDPVVMQSTAPRLNKAAMDSVVLWRYVPPSSKCRHRASITYRFTDAADA
jgi:TonB family protein